MAQLEARAIITGVDKVSPVIEAIEARVKQMGHAIEGLGRAAGTGGTVGFSKITREIAEVEQAAVRMRTAFGESGSMMNRLASDADRAAKAVSNLARAEKGAAAASRGHAAHSDGMSGRQLAIGIAGGYIAHEAAHLTHKSLETYREFDKERRYARAVMGISDEAQAPLVDQAVHMGGSTKFNDIQVLEAQRDLAARGLQKDQILGMMPAAGDLGMSMDLSLPDAVKQMEGAIFGFKKDISTTEAASRSARQTADIQVRASKMSGMTPEDIRDTYKYGATPARLSGVSEETLLAFGGISKKANMGGSEAGTAFRALMSAANAPTRGAKEAMLANHLDYKNYQRKIDHIDVDPFVNNVAAQYGVKLNDKARGALKTIFNDPKLLNDPAKFTPAVTDALGSALGKKDAKSLKSIAGMANRFRTASGGGADVNAMLTDLMKAMSNGKSGIALANAIFGAKQGGRIANALGDPETLNHMIDLLEHHSEGYSKNVADQRMAGFDGAMSRLEGATMNLESAIGRALDNGGKGGFLTSVTNQAARFVQSVSEASPHLQRLGIAAGGVAAAFAGLKGLESLMGGFGLKGAALELTAAARELMGAARIQKFESGLPGGGLPGGGKAGGKTSLLRRAGRIATWIPGIGLVYETGKEALDALNEDVDGESGPNGVRSREATRAKMFGPWLPAPKHMGMGGNAHASTFAPEHSPTGGASLDGLNRSIFETKDALSGIGGMTVAPQVDASGIKAASAEADALLAKLKQVPTAAAAAFAAIGRGAGAPMNVGTSAPGTGPAGRTPTGR